MIARAVTTVIFFFAVTIVGLGDAAFAANGADLRRVVQFQEGTPWPVQQQVVADSGSRLLRALPLINGVSIVLPAADPAAALTYLQSHPAVAGVHSDPRFRAHGVAAVIAQGAGADGAGADGAGADGAGADHVVFVTPVAPPKRELYPWGIERIGAADVHDDRPRVTGDGVKVAVFDTGIDRRHPDLARNIAGGFNAIADADPDDYNDDNGHGTAMAGIIAAGANRQGVIGAAPDARLYVVKVLDKNGSGHTSDTIYALGEIVSRPDIRLINMSYGTSLVWPLFPVAVQRAAQAGKIIVTARGNGCTGAGMTAHGAGADGAGADGAGADGAGADGAGADGGCNAFAVKYPAAYPEVIAVGATTVTNEVPSYSLSGWVDMVAPGGGGDSAEPILTTNLGRGYGVIIGTSPAAAHVSGAVALMLQRRPRLSLEEVVRVLQQTANHLDCPKWPAVSPGCEIDRQGAGLIDVRAILEELRGPLGGHGERRD